MTRITLTRRALVSSAAIAALPARAQGLPEGFPRRPITFMAPFTPGGPVDSLVERI